MPIAQASLANLGPAWNSASVPRNTSRRSRKTDRAIRTFRDLTPEAALYAGRVLRDEEESTRYRLQAMEAILKYGMPKNLEELLARAMGEGGRAYMRVEFVRPGDTAADVDAKPNGHGTFEVSFGDR